MIKTWHTRCFFNLVCPISFFTPMTMMNQRLSSIQQRFQHKKWLFKQMGRHATGHKFVHRIRLRGVDGSIVREFVLDEREMRDGSKKRVFVPNQNILTEPEFFLKPPTSAQPSEEAPYYDSLPQQMNIDQNNQLKPEDLFGTHPDFTNGFTDFDISYF